MTTFQGLEAAFIDKVLATTVPSFQLTCRETRNLGFGFVYYGMVRSLRPARVVVIGSKAGFAPVCFAKAIIDNCGHGISAVDCEETELVSTTAGTLDFIDPSYSLHRGDTNHSYGLGNWDDPKLVDKLWSSFGVESVVTHHKTRSDEFLRHNPDFNNIDILYIDGDHSFEGVTHDMLQFKSRLSENAIVLAHDVDPNCREAKGFDALNALPKDSYEYARIPFYPGLAIMRPIWPTPTNPQVTTV